MEKFALKKLAKEEGKLHIVSVKKEEFPVKNKVLKYFSVNGKVLDRCHVPDVTKEEYADLAKDFKKTVRFNEANICMDTASVYYLRKARLMKMAKDLGMPVSKIDAKDYIWDERYYVHADFLINIDIVDDWFRNESHSDRVSSKQAYIDMDAHQAVLDMQLYVQLSQFCTEVYKKGKVLAFCKVAECRNFLKMIIGSTDGLHLNCNAGQLATMRKYKAYFEELMTNEEFKKFLETYSDFQNFADTDAVEVYGKFYKEMDKDPMYLKHWVMAGASTEMLQAIIDKAEESEPIKYFED